MGRLNGTNLAGYPSADQLTITNASQGGLSPTAKLVPVAGWLKYARLVACTFTTKPTRVDALCMYPQNP